MSRSDGSCEDKFLSYFRKSANYSSIDLGIVLSSAMTAGSVENEKVPYEIRTWTEFSLRSCDASLETRSCHQENLEDNSYLDILLLNRKYDKVTMMIIPKNEISIYPRRILRITLFFYATIFLPTAERIDWESVDLMDSILASGLEFIRVLFS